MQANQMNQIKELIAESQSEAKPEAEDEQVAEEVIDVADTVDGSLPDGEGVGVEEAAEGSADTDGDEAQAADAEAALETYTPDSLSEAIGWDTEQLYTDLLMPMTNGDTIPLGQVKDQMQTLITDNETLNTQLKEAKTSAETAQTGATKNQQLSQEMIQHLGMLDQIDRTEKETDWTELESLDPMEAVLKRDKITRARNEVNAKLGQIQQAEQVKQQEYMQQAQAKMLELVPAWKDGEVFKTDRDAMSAIMNGYGFSNEEISTIVDPRQMQLLNDYAKLKAKAGQADAAVNRVRAAPKVLKGRKAVLDKNAVKDKIINKAKSGRRQDEINAGHAILQSHGLKA